MKVACAHDRCQCCHGALNVKRLSTIVGPVAQVDQLVPAVAAAVAIAAGVAATLVLGSAPVHAV